MSWIALCRFPQALRHSSAGAFFVTRTKTNMKYHRVYSHQCRTKQPASVPTKASRSTDLHESKIIPAFCGAFRSAIQKPENVWYSDNNFTLSAE